jgi:hypothetical protein
MRPPVCAALASIVAVAGVVGVFVACSTEPEPASPSAPDPADAAAAESEAADAEDAAIAPRALEWPNADHPATSDPWLVEHHDELVKMRPRVLAINLDNDAKTRSAFKAKIGEVVAGLNEGSRYHGYSNASALPFLEYEVAKWVDLADATPPSGWTHKYSSRVPVRCTKDRSAFYTADYAKLFSDEFTNAYDVADPKDPTKKLGLCEMFGRGMIHEVWLYMNGDRDPYTCPDGSQVDVGFAEILESKPIYTLPRTPGAPARAKPGELERCAGNGCLGDADFEAFKACGRTVRVLYVNSTRGPGCAIHSAGHGYEWMARCDAVPELRPRFEVFGNFDLRQRHGLSFSDWYSCNTDDCLTFSGPNSLAWKVDSKSGSIAAYDQACGNVHFAPNARAHYDENDTAVLSTCEHFGLGGGTGGRDLSEPFSRAKYARYETLAPDCGGAWQVYWRQSFPGLGNLAKDKTGQPVRNWWPYLFY